MMLNNKMRYNRIRYKINDAMKINAIEKNDYEAMRKHVNLK